jgi:hypothetical protein
MTTNTAQEGMIRRANVTEKDAYAAQRIFAEHVRAESVRLAEREAKRDALLQTAYAPIRGLVEADGQAMSAVRELAPMVEEKKREFARAHEERAARRFPDPTADAEPRALPEGTLFAPPYDYEWTELLGAADPAAGTLLATALGGTTGERIESGAGLGITLTSPTTVNVRVSAHMPIHYQWSTLVINGTFARVDGHARVIVFRDDGAVVLYRDAVLFDRQLPAGGAEGQDDTFLVWTSAAHPVFQMEAGRTYWAWHYSIAGAVGNGNLAGATVDCRMPFVIVAPV